VYRGRHFDVLVDAFGVYSNPAVSTFLQDVPIRRLYLFADTLVKSLGLLVPGESPPVPLGAPR
jgi:hypothetical protein